jgi:tripartite-type tricarboxylate transporter receptor subunit TctC
MMAGHILIMFISTSWAVEPAEAGKVKLLGIGSRSGSHRCRTCRPAESVPGFAALSGFGLFGPAGLPKDVLTKLSGEIKKIYADPAFRRNPGAVCLRVDGDVAGGFAAFIKADAAKWQDVIKAANVAVE